MELVPGPVRDVATVILTVTTALHLYPLLMSRRWFTALTSLFLLLSSVITLSGVVLLMGAPLDYIPVLSVAQTLTASVTIPLMNAQYNSKDQVLYKTVSYASVLGAWLGAVPMFLDWNQPWHSFPTPVIRCCIVGYVGGHVIARVQQYCLQTSHTKLLKSQLI